MVNIKEYVLYDIYIVYGGMIMSGKMDIEELKKMSYVDGNDFFGDVPSLKIAENYEKVYDYIKDVWEDTPDDVIIHFYGRDITAREFFEEVEKTAKSLKAKGIEKGDTVVTNLDACPEFIILFFACELICANVKNKIGADAKELSKIINDSKAKCYFTHDYVSDEDLQVIYDGTKIEQIVLVNAVEHLNGDYTQLRDINKKVVRAKYTNKKSTDVRNTNWSVFIQYGEGYNGKLYEAPNPGEKTMLFYAHTSGSTGKPKCIGHTSSGVLHKLDDMIFPAEKQNKRDTWWWPIYPTSLVAAITAYMCLPLAQGQTIILDPYLDDEDLAESFMHYKPNRVGLTPFMVKKLKKNLPQNADLSFLKVLGLAAAQFTKKELSKLQEWLPWVIISQGWGASEMNGNVTLAFVEHLVDGGAGIPLRNTKICVVDPVTKKVLPRGQVGVLCVYSPSLMVDSTHFDDVMIELGDGNKWLYSCDYGCVSDKGEIFVYGRDKVKSKTGNELYPLQIENKVSEIDGIAEVYVLSSLENKKNSNEGYCLCVKVEEGIDMLEMRERINAKLSKVLKPEELPSNTIVFDSQFEFPSVAFKIDKNSLATIVVESIKQHVLRLLYRK